jgi:hypothetical protein
VQIYVSAMNSLMTEFDKAKPYGITYQLGMLKNGQPNVLNTMEDTTQFKKRQANGNKDNGKYASTKAFEAFAATKNCARSCLYSQTGERPLIQGAQKTSITGTCIGCAALFENHATAQVTIPVTPISNTIGNAATGTLPPLGEPTIPDYTDQDGSPRVGRPADPTTTTRKIYYAPPPIGVVGGGIRPWMTGSVVAVIFLASIIN